LSAIYSFGEWIRRRRKTLDLTQHALANLVGCAVVTIKKIEQDERRPSRLMAERLADSLSIPAGEKPAFLLAALGEQSPDVLLSPVESAPPRAAKPISSLPQPSIPLIGRQKELREASRLLRRHVRLLTLTGTGGVGKSRLALELAYKLCPDFPDGVFYISLASIQDTALIVSKIAEGLKIKECGNQSLQETIIEQIYHLKMLLLLDNFEHLLSAASLVAELLSAATGLRVLITSRTPLHLSGEHLMIIQPLNLPEIPPGAQWSDALPILAHSDVVRLFVSCARARSPEFKLSEANGSLVVDICRKLDGLPLAIQLAAAQVRHLPITQLRDRLEHRLNLLTDGFRDFPVRHQALRNAFDWSYTRQDPLSQRLFPRLGIFSGGFTVESAEEVCGSEQTSNILAGLVDNSMIYRSAESRYDMLETTREYALERLEIAGETESIHRAHLEYYLRLAEAAEPHLWDQEQEEWRQRLMVDLDNIRSALHWSLERPDSKPDEIEMGARLIGTPWYFWYLIGAISEARHWLEIAIQRVNQDNAVRAHLSLALGSMVWQRGDLPTAVQAVQESIRIYRLLEDNQGLAEATHIYAHLIFDQQNYSEAEEIFRESLAMYETLGNQVLVGTIMCDLGMVVCQQGRLQTSRKYYDESLEIFDRLNVKDGKAQTFIRLGDITRLEGDYQKASELYEQALSINRELHIRQEIACAIHKLGFIALHQGDIHHGMTLFKESLAMQCEGDNLQGIAECLAGLASSQMLLGKGEQAARLFGAAKGILIRTGLPMALADQVEWQRDENKARAMYDHSSFEKAWSEGEGLNLKQAIELANQS
jgi:predicted ATPase/DNA-binding XRE family transcriptional regulator/Tfp pilus assembly protein PilF